MYSLLLLLSLLNLSSGIIHAPGANCECVNPFVGRSQSYFGDKAESCNLHGFCFVKCDSDCGDVRLAEGFLAKADRCVSKEPCHAAAEESEFAVNVKLAEKALKVLNPWWQHRQSVLIGTGAVVRYQGHGLGLYTYDADAGYYAQQGGDYYLVKDREGWFTFPRISGCTSTDHPFSCIAQYAASIKTKNLTGTWSFAKDEVWTEDDSIQFLPISSTPCLSCKKISLSSDGQAMQDRPEYFGSFERQLTFSAGRPVYKNKAGKFLMMKNEYSTFSVWEDAERRVSAGKGDDEGTRGLRSKSGPACVTGAEGWQYLTKSGGWVEDKTVTAKCVE